MMLLLRSRGEVKRGVDRRPRWQGDDGLATAPAGTLVRRCRGGPYGGRRRRYDGRGMLCALPLRPRLEPLVVYRGGRVTGRARGVDHLERVQARPASYASRLLSGLRRFVRLLVPLALPA